jgi:uncharacterized protein YidB (DUF937 family)
MGFFDTLKDAAGEMAGSQEAHEAFGAVLEKTPLGGMDGLLDQLEQGGLGSAVHAWCAGEDHPAVSPDQIKDALGEDHLQHIASSLGISPDEAAAHLSEHLPQMTAAHADAAADEAVDDEDSADQSPAHDDQAQAAAPETEDSDDDSEPQDDQEAVPAGA